MITIFAVPKPFQGHVDVIQRNAIGSWVRMDSGLQVILFGNEYGTKEVAREFGIEHALTNRCTRYGTPFVDDIFYSAEQRAANSLLCYINCDIILQSDFLRAARSVGGLNSPALMIGECRQVDIRSLLELENSDWERQLRIKLQACGTSRGPFAIDYFLFTRGLFDRIPPFIVGRTRYDNWLVWKALKSRAKVINATGLVDAVHQKHDYTHIPGGYPQTLWGAEARCNRKLAGFWCNAIRVCSVLDATHLITAEGIRKRSVCSALIVQFWIRFRLYIKEKLH